jgi:hypothetical protein
MVDPASLDHAIAAHAEWKFRLREAIKTGQSGWAVENVRPDDLCRAFGFVGIVPKDRCLGFLSLTLDKVMPGASRRKVRDEGQGHATRDTPSAGKFQRVGKARPRARFALARLIRVSSPFTELLLDLRHAVLQDRELGDGHHVGQDGPPCPEPNRLGIGLLSEIGDPINRFRGHAGQLQFSGTPATGFLGRLGGQASSPISCCCNDMLSLDCRLEGAPSVPKSCKKCLALGSWCAVLEAQAAVRLDSGKEKFGSARTRRQCSSSPLRRAASRAASAKTPSGDQLIP